MVHLAGDNVGSGSGPLAFLGRWSDEKKRDIYDSRIVPTRHLARALASLKRRPAVLVCASGVGYYGATNSGGLLTEDSPPGHDFLAHMARDWEGACADAATAGIRVVNTRFGAVLSKDGGMLGEERRNGEGMRVRSTRLPCTCRWLQPSSRCLFHSASAGTWGGQGRRPSRG